MKKIGESSKSSPNPSVQKGPLVKFRNNNIYRYRVHLSPPIFPLATA
jgi:hypothetical protein